MIEKLSRGLKVEVLWQPTHYLIGVRLGTTPWVVRPIPNTWNPVAGLFHLKNIIRSGGGQNSP